jgi:hypothetical protein
MIHTRQLEKTQPLLGRCLAIYKAPRFDLWQAAAVVCLACLLFLLPLGIALFRAFTGFTGFGPVAAAAWSKTWFYLALGGLFISIGVAARAILLSRRRISLHVYGLRLRGFPYPWTRDLCWSQLAGLSTEYLQQGGASKPFRCRLTLHTKQGLPVHVAGRTGEPLRAGELPELSDLVIRLKEYLYPRLQPALLQSLADGTTLFFGPLALDRLSLRLGRFVDPVPWEQILLIQVEKGHLVVELKKEGLSPHQFSVPVSKIPNLELFLHLVEQGEIISSQDVYTREPPV